MKLNHLKKTLCSIALMMGLGMLLSGAAQGGDLTVSDGVVVKFGADAGMEVRDSLHMSGLSTFTSIKDDSVSGQTGAAPQIPAAGDWRGVKLEASATNFQLDGLTLRYGGASGESAFSLRKISPTLRYLSIENSLLGVRVTDSAAPNFTGLSLVGNSVGLETNGNARPVITGSDIHGNNTIGVRNLTPATVVQATGNWWGNNTGPKDTVANPLGLGDMVSTGVNYGSYLTQIPLINPSVRVVGGITYTEQRDLTLALSCRNAIDYRVAENGNFTGVAFALMTSSVPFTLSASDGVKQISAQYRSSDGNLVTASLAQGVLYDVAGPVLNVTNPAAGSYINNSITISATATDSAGVAKVEFYINNVLAATDTSSPYSYAWDVTSASDGAYNLKVIAYDAVGHSSIDTRSVTLAKAAPPPPDTEGPVLASLSLGGTAVSGGSTLTRSGTLTVSATDRSAISRIDFYVDGTLIGSDSNGADGYSAYLDLYSVTDGAHDLKMYAYDSLNNQSQTTVSVTVALAPPSVPTISAPANNYLTNLAQVTVSGSAEKLTQVSILNNGIVVAGPVAVTSAGTYSLSVPITNGSNSLQASASNRGGASLPSSAVLVTVDVAIPAAPLGLNAVPQTAGKIRLTWNRSLDSKVTGYHIYRSSVSFNNITEAVKVTSTAIAVATTVYDDLPSTDGTYYYRVVAINALNTRSDPSNEVIAVSDNTLPKAVQIAYAPTGRVDSATGRIATGRVDVTVTVSEPLIAAPFLSIAPQNGIPLAIDLIKSTDTVYRGSFTITSGTPSGTAYAVFSARDMVGNRGTEIVQGTSILIDAQGPSLTGLVPTPATPIKNDATAPTTVSLNLTLNEAIKSGQSLQMSYVLSSSPASPVAITGFTQTGPLTWTGSFTLPAGAGQNQIETLSFTYSGVDDLDNVSTAIATVNNFQVYQGNLPPLAPPLNFAGVAQPGGKVQLTWSAVDTAAAYELYRQAPGEASLTAYQRLTLVTTYVDNTTADGIYRYAIATIRQANTQESESAQSTAVQISADAQAPSAPQNIALLLIGSGIQATWTAPTEGAASYNLYRANTPTITTIQGLTPIKTGIHQLGAIDPSPSSTDHAYAVTALDAAGNESAPSTSAFLDFALLPVANLTVVQNGNALPVLTWTQSGNTVIGYDIFLGPANAQEKLNLTPVLVKTFTDSGYASDERRYTVVGFDNNSATIGRSITLPKISASLNAGIPVKRGLMNRLQYQVSNQGTSVVSGITLKSKILSRENISDPFSLNPGESKLVSVVVGGFADIPSQTPLTTTVEVVPEEGAKVQIVRAQDITAQDGALVLTVAPENLTRGATGKVRFTLENTSDVDIEILTATQSGKNPSTDIRYKLLDKDSNVLATQSFKQALGDVITLSNGQTVARLAAGASFTSDLIDLVVPSSAPDSITVQLEIDHYLYKLGTPLTVSIPGQTSRQAATLIDTTYYAEITGVSPLTSFGDQDVVIQGRAVARATASALPNVSVKLILNVNGFERRYDLYTDSTGNFTYTFKPTASDGGVYKISALHPDMLERPVQAQFVINSLALQYSSYKLTNARNYPFTIKMRATAGDGTQVTNLHFVYQASDQTGGALPGGVSVIPGAPLTLGSKQGGDLSVTVMGDNTAAETGSFILKVFSDERGTIPVGSLRVDYRFTNATPALYPSPSYVETGLAQGGSVLEQVTLENRGFADAQGVSATLLNTDGTPAPNWLYLQGGNTIGTLAIGEKRSIDIAVAPPATLGEGIYSFKLRVAAANAQGGDVPIYVSITQSGVGNALFKFSDIYTATLDKNGNRISGLAGARITMQNELVTSVTQTITSDSLGEAYFTNLPAGQYKFRATALNHQEVIGRVTVKPGITLTEDVFLDYNLVTVEWSVKEVTVQDKYEIILHTTFQTNVPAAVIALEPASVTLPTMKAGDVFYGEITLTNYGLIRADSVGFTPPASDGFFRFEFLSEIPATLEAKQRLTIPYRVVSLASLDQPAGSATGGGCGTVQRTATVLGSYVCANGALSRTSSSTSWFYVYGSCPGGGTSVSTGGGGGIGGGTGGGFSGGSPSYTSLPNAPCIPPAPCPTCGVGNDGGGK